MLQYPFFPIGFYFSEAKLIMHDANQKAEMIVKDARDSLKRIYQEVGEMKRARIQFEANLRSIAQAHLAMLDQSHQIMPDYQNQNMNWGMGQQPQQPMQQSMQQSNMQQPMQQQPVQQMALQNNQTVAAQHAQQMAQQKANQQQQSQGTYNFGAQSTGQTISTGYPVNGMPQKAQGNLAAATNPTLKANPNRPTTGL